MRDWRKFTSQNDFVLSDRSEVTFDQNDADLSI